MAKELITRAELLSIAHRQGFDSLDEVDSCVLEPGGTFVILGKEPRLADRHHRELLDRLDGLGLRLDELTRRLDAAARARADGGGQRGVASLSQSAHFGPLAASRQGPARVGSGASDGRSNAPT